MNPINRAITKVTIVNAAINTLLAVFKIFIGWFGQSQALLADGVHSLSDLISDAFVYFAAIIGHREADHDHPYGHRRVETVAAVIIALILIIVGVMIAYDTIERIWLDLPMHHPSHWVVVVAAISVIANEFLYRYTLKIGKQIKSQLLKNNAWHNRSDAFVSLIVLISVFGSYFRIPYLDAIAALFIAILILRMGIKMIRNGLRELVDTGVDDVTLEKIKQIIFATHGVAEIHMLRTRMLGGNIFVDVHIIVDPRITVSEGHHISDQVQKNLRDDIENITDVTVHIDPEDDEKFMPSLQSPNRPDLLNSIEDKIQHLPGYHEIKKINLHYLDGKVEIELFMPMSSYQPDLAQKYQNALAGQQQVEKVVTFFS